MRSDARSSPSVYGIDPWQRAGVTHEEWVAARLKVAALVRAVEQGDPGAVRYVLQIPGRSERDEGPR